MPELELPDLHNIEAGVYLQGVMFEPRGSHDDHQRFVASMRNLAVANVLRKHQKADLSTAAAAMARDAAIGPRFDDEVRRTARLHWTRGGLNRAEIAAKLLMLVLSYVHHDPARASKEKAYAVWRRASDSAKISDSSRANLVKIFDDFHPAAHLWAAATFAPSVWEQSKTGGGIELAAFLGFAEHIRKLAETARLDGGTLLDPCITWKVPDRFILPRWDIPMPHPSVLEAQMMTWASRPV